MDENQDFILSAWRVQPTQNCISDGQQSKVLEPRVMALLVCLAVNQGRVVSPETLKAEVWDDAHLSEGVVRRAVSKLRKALGDSSKEPRFIRTISKQGYLLLMPVMPVESAKKPAPLPAQATPKPPSPALRRRRISRKSTWVAAALVLAALFWIINQQGDTMDAPRETPVTARYLPVSSVPGFEAQPALSPDGGRVVYSGQTEVGVRKLFLWRREHLETRQLTVGPGRDMRPCWAPDNKRVAFVRATPNGPALMMIEVASGQEEVLYKTNAGILGHLDWHPSGKTLAYNLATFIEGVHGIYLFEPATRTSRSLTRLGPGQEGMMVGDVYPKFSPDGTQLAFVRWAFHGPWTIHVIDLSTGELRALVQEGSRIYGLAWRRDGKTLIYPTHGGVIWSVPAAGGQPTMLLQPGFNGWYPATSRESDAIAVQVEHGGSTIHRWENGTSRRWIDANAADYHPAFGPSGKRLAFVSQRHGPAAIWIETNNVARLLPMTGEVPLVAEQPQWSPDGRRIAFSGKRGMDQDIYWVSAEGGRPQGLVRPDCQDLMPGWGPDGHLLYFSSNQGGTWRTWWVDTTDPSRVGTVGPETAFRGRVGPDGQWLYYVIPTKIGLFRFHLESGNRERLLDDLPTLYWAGWEVHAEAVYYIRGSQQNLSVARFDLRTQEVIDLFTLQSNLAPWSLAVQPGGKVMALVQPGTAESDIILIQP